MEIYQAITLGILQGLTEFLPVSSSGHLVLGQLFFDITDPMLAFDISVHMGTLAAVLVVYFREIRAMVGALGRGAVRLANGNAVAVTRDPDLMLAAMIIVGSFPTAFIGFFLKQFEEILFTSGLLVGCMLLVTGTLLWLSRKYYRDDDDGNAESRLSPVRAVIIGISQGMAVIPGISRSGTTIACGMFLGLNRETAARFSFLLSIPAILGAQMVSIKDSLEQGQNLIDPATAWGTLVSFVTGLVALKLLLRLVHNGKFHYFAPYCWLVGVVVLVSHLI